MPEDAFSTAAPKNWAGTYAYRAATRAHPRDLDEVVQLVRSGGGRIHALGTRHSFTDLPDTEGTLIDLSALRGDVVIDAASRTAVVPAGTRYGVLALKLEAEGWALHNMGSLPHIGVAGATATGTHGSGNGNGVLSTAVRALRYVGADGEVHDTRRGDADFAALVVGLGAFGLVTEVTLDLEPSYRMRQDVYTGVTWEAALADLDALTSAAYSVSVFTKWEGDEVGYVWTKTRLDTDHDGVPATLLDGALAAKDDSPLASDDNVTELGGVPGPWMLRLPHFRLDREPSFGAEIQTEYFVDRADAPAALRAVRELAPQIRPHLVVSELRTAARDQLWLSGAYERDFLAIHFTWLDRPEEVSRVIPHIEAALAPFAARPHWGKVHAFNAERMAAVHPRLADARAVFERLDPAGRFVNAHLERVGVREPR
ncbi:D-arabinono-1,4-lactone oxidase [Microbacterium sp. P06]|uniref:D-arabinono-1,4-lactone oxidase n=1 Tax=Microbacterium sp. P06 TaxID=3366949 RepID=UPI003746D993